MKRSLVGDVAMHPRPPALGGSDLVHALQHALAERTRARGLLVELMARVDEAAQRGAPVPQEWAREMAARRDAFTAARARVDALLVKARSAS